MHQWLMALTKKITGAIAAIALVIMVTIVTFAFKADNKIESKAGKVLVDQWYFIDATSNATSDQEITSTTGSAPNDPSCNTINLGLPCAVRLSFSGSVPSLPAGTTVEEAVDDFGATVGIYTRKQP